MLRVYTQFVVAGMLDLKMVRNWTIEQFISRPVGKPPMPGTISTKDEYPIAGTVTFTKPQPAPGFVFLVLLNPTKKQPSK